MAEGGDQIILETQILQGQVEVKSFFHGFNLVGVEMKFSK